MSAEPESNSAELVEEIPEEPGPLVPLLLFFATVWSVFHAGALLSAKDAPAGALFGFFNVRFLLTGAPFALPLLSILVVHEFGHYAAARIHRLPSSLPYFIPLPLLGLFGTLGALIGMRDEIRSRNGLLDVGASGPLAGFVVALPVLIWGLLHSTFQPLLASGYTQEGSSLLYVGLKYALLGPTPAGQDLELHPTALAGWTGLFLTMLNLFWWGQLDGGHIAYALLGERHHRIARWSRRALLLLFGYNLARFVVPVLLGQSQLGLRQALSNSSFWLIWFVVLQLIERFSGEAEHPPFEPGPLSRGRKLVGWFCVALFALLFMPTPIALY
jgi:membrane-associated protease RseP (regulator of RpoE activity)